MAKDVMLAAGAIELIEKGLATALALWQRGLSEMIQLIAQFLGAVAGIL